jgi:hypothetical protein
MLSRIVKKQFCSGTPYHHDFHPGHFDKKAVDFGLALFEFGRIFFYVYFSMKIAVHSTSYLAFRKSRFLNNPDYAICDVETFQKMKIAKELKK